MGDIQPPAPDSEKGPVEAPPIEDLATVVLGMNRFLSRFSTLQAFKDAQLSVADWTVMMILFERKEGRAPLLAIVSGIADQRIARIVETLIAAGLVVTVESDDPARPAPVLKLTEAGHARLAALNDALQGFFLTVTSGNKNFYLGVKGIIGRLLTVVK
jgi:DNA-binding MarR family transcriptional regulator